MRRGAFAVAVAVAAVAWSCRAIPAPDNGVLSVSEVQLASPGVVVNDTMRDSTGQAVPLHVYAFGVGGQTDTITTVKAQYFVLDPGAHVSPDGYLIGDSVRSTPVRVIGSVGTLQTSAANVYVTPLPDSITFSGAQTTATDTFSLAKPTSYYSPPVTAHVLSAGTPPAGVQAVIVQWAIVQQPAAADSATAGTLVAPNNHPVSADTTDASGNVSVRVHLDPVAVNALTGPDTFVVEARASYGGVPLRGSPVQFKVPVFPAPPVSGARSGKS
jgi:hypothetical protein